MKPLRIAVIGVGPRGLSVLERVVSHTRRAGPPVELLLVEPDEPGIGVHRSKQPDYLLLNTIASQLTVFSDTEMVPGAPVTPGPAFDEWCAARGVPAAFDAFLPRRLLGEYLQWATGELLAAAPERLTVRHIPAVATRVRPGGDGATVTLADGTEHRVDLAVVTTGHGLAVRPPGPADGWIETPYPLPDQLDGIPDGAAVAVLGTGLTAMDVVACLTVGRGGVFTGDGYRASGREPRIVLANRAGPLPRARPNTTRQRRSAPAAHFTPAAVAALRERTPDGRLDFRRDVEPLILREALARLGADAGADAAATVERALAGGGERPEDYAAYTAALLEQARADLAEARRGLGASPVKEALEVLRDHRDSLRAALDPPGLTDASHRYFMTEYAALVNRTVIGPQKERVDEVLRLMAAGVVRPGPGPAPRLDRDGDGWTLSSTRLRRPHRMAVDLVVRANLGWPAPDPLTDPLGQALREWAAPGQGGALRLDRDGFVVPRPGAGAAGRTVAVLGPPAEGASYYNHYVPSPGVRSRALTDVDRVLAPVLGAPATTG
ncbi:FAD/NAD(P)-binding protein [Actinacidiphila sp. ITFR-21]|uniref:FAD/NAD(P)-binding protein n=1 Tax=Actinacidiphila sp. ITFR-21 TaxID=3075199 RepID=UPI00288C4D25|nr:FAD/NAD(P)-binding protein [Streptomyces sp. ITFR-21]WNI18865.1 FAD/NAD(P)-binding protein [Streptomyces sp. ITFR-21]